MLSPSRATNDNGRAIQVSLSEMLIDIISRIRVRVAFLGIAVDRDTIITSLRHCGRYR